VPVEPEVLAQPAITARAIAPTTKVIFECMEFDLGEIAINCFAEEAWGKTIE
jgi:hypothetical protein